MSFYRNYDRIEDILIEHLDSIVEQYKKEDTYENIKEAEKVYYGKKWTLAYREDTRKSKIGMQQ